MIALCVDDEPLMLRALQYAVEEARQITQVVCFEYGEDALSWAEKNRPDIAFLDVQLCGMTGLALAQGLVALYPELPVIFCTGHREYAYDAFQVHAAGYLLKPVTARSVQKELDRLTGQVESRLTLHCFGSFEVYAEGRPLIFRRKKAKEMLAYLTDRRGALIGTNELCAVLWEDESNDRKKRNYLYQIVAELKASLREVGLEEVLVNRSSGYTLDLSRVECDYYRYLEGDAAARRLFVGQYMQQYSWAEATCSGLLTAREWEATAPK